MLLVVSTRYVTYNFVSFDSRSPLLMTSTQVGLRFIGEDIRALPVKCTMLIVCPFLNFVHYEREYSAVFSR